MDANPELDEPMRSAAVPLRPRKRCRSALQYLIVSVLLLVPCFWQTRIEAGDLSSHVYNAWVAQLVAQGKLPGLWIAHQTTNVLTDVLMSGLLRVLGSGAAQRITVAVAVLVFAWGAFAFVSAAGGRRATDWLPAIAILAYGWTFHMGFLNFYLSLGVCFFAMAIAWNGGRKALAVAAILFGIAYVAHALPVAWALAVLNYRWLSLRLPSRFVNLLPLGSAGAILAATVALTHLAESRRSPLQILAITAADQAWVYDAKYRLIMLALIAVGGVLFVLLIRHCGARKLLESVPFQIAFLTAFGIAVLPTGIALPGYKHGLIFIAERMSLALGVCYCALFSYARPPKIARFVLLGIALVFFGFLYRDDSVLNRYEDRIQGAVSHLQGQRVIMGFDDPYLRVNAFTHMIDRACLGVCYSYANYEASTGQFRLRVSSPNPYVVATYEDSWLLQSGSYIVKPSDLPLFRVDLQPDGSIVAHSLQAGAPSGMAPSDLLHRPPH